MTDEIKPVLGLVGKDKPATILVPRGFQNKQLVRPTDPEHPEYGECMTCKGTGAEVLGVQLLDPVIVNGRIEECKPTLQLVECKCTLGQFWIKFHPLNVQAKIFPKWAKEIREFTEREKVRILSESGGNYNYQQDTFLNSLGYQNPDPARKKKLVVLDDILQERFKKDGLIG